MCTDTTIEFGSRASLSMSSIEIMSTLLYTYKHLTYLHGQRRDGNETDNEKIGYG